MTQTELLKKHTALIRRIGHENLLALNEVEKKNLIVCTDLQVKVELLEAIAERMGV